MNQTVNINLNSSSKSFKYKIEYINTGDEYVNNENICWTLVDDNINIYKKSEIFIEDEHRPHEGYIYFPYTGNINLSTMENDVIAKYSGKIKLFTIEDDVWMMFDDKLINKFKFIRRNNNEWLLGPQDTVSLDFIPQQIHSSTLRVYFPEYSIDTFERGVKYILSVNTWVNGKPVYLANNVLLRTDALAAPIIKRDGENNYFESIDIDIIDPYSIVYGDEWSEFRTRVCGKTVDINEGVSLYVSLTPISITEDEDKYIKMKDYSGGQNFININPNLNDYFNMRIKYVHGSPDKVIANIILNNQGDLIKSYLNDTYNINVDNVDVELAILDEEQAYRLIPPTHQDLETMTFEFERNNNFDQDQEATQLCFPSWNGWHEGMYMMASATFKEDGVDAITIFSNKIILTKELFKYLVGDKIIYNINLDNMKILNINAVNKIEQKVIQMDKPENSKSNIISPVFFRSQELNNIIIHPGVIENIAINLDSYKSLVNTFMLQVEGISFSEIGRSNNGVIFKIIGKSLPGLVESGTYFITDIEGNMITSGKYKYVK